MPGREAGTFRGSRAGAQTPRNVRSMADRALSSGNYRVAAALGRVADALDEADRFSRGGARWIAATARDPKVAALVYVALLAPDEGKTVADVFCRGQPHPRAPEL